MVVLVLAIAAAIAVPMFANTHASRLRAAAEMLAADLAYAQVESMTHADDLRLVRFDAVSHRYAIVAMSNPNEPIHNPIADQPYEVTFGQGRASPFHGVTILHFNLGGDNTLLFGQYGQLDQTTPATITLACRDRTITLTVDPVLGQVSIGPIE